MLLKFIRKHTKLLFIIILSLMIVPFLFWGVGSIGRQSLNEKEEIPRIHGKLISTAKLNESISDSRIMLLVDFVEGNNIKTPEQFEMYREWFNQILQQMNFNEIAVQLIILKNKVKQYGINVSQDELKNWILNFPLFQTNGVFDPGRYNSIVTGHFQTWTSAFEKALSRILAIKKLQKFIMDSVLISQNEAYESYKENNEKAIVYYAEFNNADFIPKVGDIAESEIKDYYEKHKEEFREPEKIKLSYLVFDPAQFKGKITISQKEIEDYYTANKNKFAIKETPQKETSPEKEKQENIKPLDEVKNEITELLTSEKSKELCLESALDISTQLTEEKGYGDMLKLAKEKGLIVKETVLLAKNQVFIPDLGAVPEVLQRAWRMDLNSVSDLITTGDKWVIISPIEKEESNIPELKEVENKINEIIKSKKAEELAYKTAEETLNKLPKDKSFPEAVKSLKLKVKITKPITRANELYSQTRKLIKTSKGTAIINPKKIIPIDERNWEKEKESFTKTCLEQKKRMFFKKWLAAQ